ncbi:unnamed protein product [Callosobruchus maculatus]|uniref:Class II aldolase/adducin N-terminal domain-containing protein n=1 Tax=Callosobruchus maculatus TaxID=64391 RepID=A0A653CHC1_CALMS|nr:unnamed protein product [Callosobruchus maculatus]
MSYKDQSYPEEHPKNLIPELCRQFYHLGWVTGTGGGISIKHGNKIYIAPSAVQKERIHPSDMFVQTIEGEDLELPPPEKKLKGKEFKCTHLEMIKGIKNQKTGKNFRYDEELVVPIIENTPFEEDLKDRLADTIREYPHTCAVLVRRHGVYVWGDTWQQAKTMTECYDYLFDIVVQMKQHGLDPSLTPDQYELKIQNGK